MVRDNYVLNDLAHPVSIFGLGPAAQHDLGGFRALPPELEIDWSHFFDTTPTPPINRSMRIDPFLADSLRHVPPTKLPPALLNLRRRARLKPPHGRGLAKRKHLEPLTETQLLEPLPRIDSQTSEALLRATPLWYYVLCEARQLAGDGLRLGPLGGRIVAEVLA